MICFARALGRDVDSARKLAREATEVYIRSYADQAFLAEEPVRDLSANAGSFTAEPDFAERTDEILRQQALSRDSS